MSLIFFTEKGERVPKMMLLPDDTFLPGWMRDEIVTTTFAVTNGWSFPDMRSWQPIWVAVKMARGYRVIEYAPDVSTFWIANNSDLWLTWWLPAEQHHKRLPHIAAVEMWVRMQAALR